MTDKATVTTIAGQDNLARILDSLKEGIIAHDLNRRIFFFNAEAERITGYNRSEILGRDCHEAFGLPFCGRHCSFCTNTPIVEDHVEYILNITTKNGEPRRIDFQATLMRDGSGEFTGVVAAFSDVTELFELRQRSGRMNRFGDIIGSDSKMMAVFKQIVEVAQYDFPVHIYGETGTGKELVANAIHNESRRGGAPFVPINCGALPEGLIESELFGHVKGAFSGAIRDKKGRFELADGGTVFLDEVAELPKPLQVKLLRFLQEGRFEKVGGERTVAVNVRIISATNKDLKKEVQRNTFREDLFYRLNVIPVHIPPLRERPTDIPALVNHFLETVAQGNGKRVPGISEAALSALMDYDWPGNVRELQNAVQFAFVRCNGQTITPEDLPMEFRRFVAPQRAHGTFKGLDHHAIRQALIKTGGNRAAAARVLGVGRATLYRYIAAYPDVTSLPDQ